MDCLLKVALHRIAQLQKEFQGFLNGFKIDLQPYHLVAGKKTQLSAFPV